MDEKKSIIAYKKKQRSKLLKKLKAAEPDIRKKEEMKLAVEKAIQEQERIKRSITQKQEEEKNKFKELRKEFPEFTDVQFNKYAREQLGLDIPKTLIEKYDTTAQIEKLKEKKSKIPKIEIIESKPSFQEIELSKKKSEELLRQQELIKKAKQERDKQEKLNELLNKYKFEDLDKKYSGKGKQGRMSEEKKAYFEIKQLQEEIPIKKKQVTITKRGKKKVEEAEPATEPAAAEPAITLPEAKETIKLSKEDEDNNIEATKLLANLKTAKDKNEFDTIFNNLSLVEGNITDKQIANEINKTAQQIAKDWHASNTVDTGEESDNSLLGQGLRKLTKRNIKLFHIPHKMIIEKKNEFILNKKGMQHAGNLSKVLHPKEFEKMLKYSILNHIRVNKH